MFDKVIPNYYDTYYGRLLSGFVHGNVAALIFKVKMTEPGTPPEVDTGVKYKEEQATFLLNQAIIYILGYLNFFPIAFPQGFASLNKPLKGAWGKRERVVFKIHREPQVYKSKISRMVQNVGAVYRIENIAPNTAEWKTYRKYTII